MKLTSLLLALTAVSADTVERRASWISSTADEVTGTVEFGEATAKQAAVDFTCTPNTDIGDNPCIEGCGYDPIPNPFNPNAAAAATQPRPSGCKDYSCICADSGCARSWTWECVKWYMQCQENQACGPLDQAPQEVQDVNIESSCAVAPTSANTPLCYAGSIEETPTPGPTPAPEGDDDDDGKGKGGKKGRGDDDDGGKGKGGSGGKKGSSSESGKGSGKVCCREICLSFNHL